MGREDKRVGKQLPQGPGQGRSGVSRLIESSAHLVFLPGFWCRAPKTLAVSQVTGVTGVFVAVFDPSSRHKPLNSPWDFQMLETSLALMG